MQVWNERDALRCNDIAGAGVAKCDRPLSGGVEQSRDEVTVGNEPVVAQVDGACIQVCQYGFFGGGIDAAAVIFREQAINNMMNFV